MAHDKYGQEVTDLTWGRVEATILAFQKLYPEAWSAFRRDLKANQTTYQDALGGDLKKSSWRNTLSFPIVARPRTQAEIAEAPGAVPVEFKDSLKDWLEEIIPGFTAPDTPGAENKLYKQFIKRYGSIFRPGEKY